MDLIPLPPLRRNPPPRAGFTLIEMLVVISIIAILMGLAFPAFHGVQNSAKKTQAKNDLVQIVTAVNAFYTEYGRYPTNAPDDASASYGGLNGANNGAIIGELRGTSIALNTRQIAFLSVPDAKDQSKPRSGVKTANSEFFDPWGTAYAIRIDADYDGQLDNPYSADTGAGAAKIREGVIGYSLGKDKDGGSGSKDTNPAKDDVISWQ